MDQSQCDRSGSHHARSRKPVCVITRTVQGRSWTPEWSVADCYARPDSNRLARDVSCCNPHFANTYLGWLGKPVPVSLLFSFYLLLLLVVESSATKQSGF